MRIDRVALRDTLGVPIGIVHYVEVVQRREGKLRSIGRRNRVANLAHRKRWRVLDRIIEINLRPQIDIYVDFKWDFSLSAAVNRDPPDLPPIRSNQCLRIRSE